MKIIAQSYLTCIDGSHNKQYLAELCEDHGSYIVLCRYGAIGAKLSSITKHEGPSHNTAMAVFTKVVGEKRAKGYSDAPVPAPLTAPGAHLLPADSLTREAATGVPRFGAQLAGDGGLAALHGAVVRPSAYRVEEKWDGFRALIVFATDGSISIRNRNGEDKGRIANTPHLESALRTLGNGLPSLWQGSVLDGELVGPTFAETATLLSSGGRSSTALRFIAFDLPWFAGADRRSLPLRDRLGELATVLSYAALPIEAASALDPDPDLAAAVWDSGGEGLIIKELDAPYAAGNRTAWAKVKQAETADAVVIGVEPGQGKYAGQAGALILGQQDAAGALVEVARVSGFTDAVRATLGPTTVGRVVEFRYQERTPSGRFRHPRFLRFRHDKAAADCRLEA
jgi:ATP-dependent DNA ligase